MLVRGRKTREDAIFMTWCERTDTDKKERGRVEKMGAKKWIENLLENVPRWRSYYIKKNLL